MKFRIQWYRDGVRFTAEYRQTVAGAIQLANSKGWFGSGDTSWSTKPGRATIEVRHDHDLSGEWEQVATVNVNGVDWRHWSELPSVKARCKRIADLTAANDRAADFHRQCVKEGELCVSN
jgi:hypothetical protein